MSFRFLSSLILSLATLLVQSVQASEWIPELESPEVARESGDGSLSPKSENDRRTILLNKLLLKARDLYAQRKFQEALEAAKYANRVQKSYLNDEVIAECLAHIARPTEAMAAVEKLPYSSWSTRVEVYETLGMYEKALAACVLPDANEDPYMLKCKLLLKHGERAKAIRLANDAFFKFDSSANPHWKEFFQVNGFEVPAPSLDPKAKAEILSQLTKLRHVHEPHGATSLEKDFGRKFTVCGRCATGLSYVSDEQLESPITRIWLRVGYEPSAKDGEKVLSLDINRGLSSPSTIEIEKALADIGKPEKSTAACMGCGSPTIKFDVLIYKLPDSVLTFTFPQSTNRLERIDRTWTLVLHKREPKPWVPPTMQMIEQELKSMQYAKAARNLMIVWERDSSDSELRQRKRRLLVQCFTSLKKPEVADYLAAAPFNHVRITVIHADCDPNRVVTTLDSYMHQLWNVSGDTSEERAHYTIRIPDCSLIDVWKAESPDFYARFFDKIGALKPGEERLVPPLPADLIDGYEFRSARAK